jgi:hypothetical protein
MNVTGKAGANPAKEKRLDEEQRLDEGLEESFPASDPASQTQPGPHESSQSGNRGKPGRPQRT